MDRTRHDLKITGEGAGKWSAECTCGGWAVSSVKSARAVQRAYAAHKKAVKR